VVVVVWSLVVRTWSRRWVKEVSKEASLRLHLLLLPRARRVHPRSRTWVPRHGDVLHTPSVPSRLLLPHDSPRRPHHRRCNNPRRHRLHLLPS